MYISNGILTVLIVIILLISSFLIGLLRNRQILMIHKIYFSAAICLIVWLLALIGLEFTDPENGTLLYVWDGVTNLGVTTIPVFSLLLAIAYTKGYDSSLPKRYYLLFVIPIITNIMIWTNPLHHLYYKVFSLDNSTVEFGPYFNVHAAYCFLCTALSIFVMVRFAFTTKTKLHIQQAILFSIGSLAPSLVSVLVIMRVIKATIITTPLAFALTLFFHGFIIYRLHFFDIKPIGIQRLVDWMSDCYLITSATGIVVNYNHPFYDVFGKWYGIQENANLSDCLKDEDVENKTAIYNLLTAIHSCSDTAAKISYEQALSIEQNGEVSKYFYMVEVTALIVKEKISGYLVIFKDVTKIKENMLQLQDSQVKMMERERLAFLGQMVGGLAHNLKTPIMSISGAASAVESLVNECEASVGDPEVTPDDYRENYGEMSGWLQKMREACSYMSDIISAVKGQASNMNVSDVADFSLDEMLKRVTLLLRHELLSSKCSLEIESDIADEIMLRGDINNLVQVINNLVSNAIDAQRLDGDPRIIIGVYANDHFLNLTVKDFGVGISPEIKKNLFKQMVTSKGNMGTGLGIFISNTVIRAKFDGSMWVEDNPEGGSVFGISIPLENVSFIKRKQVIEDEKE